MKKITLAVLIAFIWTLGLAQDPKNRSSIDRLHHEMSIAKNDTTRVLLMAKLCGEYAYHNFDPVAVYGNRGVALAQKIGFPRGEARVLFAWGGALEVRGDIPQSLEVNFKGLQIAEDNHYAYETALGLSIIGNDYWDLQDYPKAITYYQRARSITKTLPTGPETRDLEINIAVNIGDSYSKMNRLDSAYFYMQRTYDATLNDQWRPALLMFLGDVLFKMGNHQKAFTYLRQSLALDEKYQDDYTDADICKTIARFFKETNQPDSSIFYAKKGLAHAQAIGYKMDILINSQLLADQYEGKDISQAHYYLKLVTAVNEELFGAKKVKELQKILSDQQERQRKIEADRIAYQNQLKEYAFLAGLSVLLLIAFILYRNNQREKKGKKLLQEKNELIEKTLTDLKATQTQLIQSEKMASLGELTAGIAHEIQNPLNFVNNFSEVNKEMLEELKAERKKPKAEKDEQLEIEMINDLIENEEKINHHGKRADAIVKGMLQHSQAGSGKKEPTDINALADEYMRLAYHGLRAKDKTFTAEMITHFDETLPKINAIQQDIGRVMLNLFNNAFYAVNQKVKNAEPDYKPTVELTTFAPPLGGWGAKVRDNGVGIPDAVKEKIMQPFFTTKPTGEGTGLGLSLTYDIVVKGHGGKLEVNTKEGEFTEFIVSLPLNQ